MLAGAQRTEQGTEEALVTHYASVAPDSVRYVRKQGLDDGMPWLLEVAFGVRSGDEDGLRTVYGLNWAPSLGAPVPELERLLGEMRVDRGDPVTVVLHLVRPRFEFTDHGKSRVALMPGTAAALSSAVRSVAREWKQAKLAAGRSERVSRAALARMRSSSYRVTIREVAFRVMEAAYLKASGNGRYPANARQIFYAARPSILAQADATTLDSQYFCQTLLKEYMETYWPAWDVVFDARGHFTEPHTEKEIGLGGLAVRQYVSTFSDVIGETPELALPRRVEVVGPGHRYGGVLFVEKEGFAPILKAAQIAERYDLAVTSTKGMPVSAACDLLGEIALPVYVLHDFDKAGFSIVQSLRAGTRGSRQTPATVIDLGFRLADIDGLERELVTYTQEADPGWNLRDCGATEEEIAVLVAGTHRETWIGERVEINAMTSDRFVSWLEAKLEECGVAKVQPSEEVLVRTYRRACYLVELDRRVKALREQMSDMDIEVPEDVAESVCQSASKTDPLSASRTDPPRMVRQCV